MSMKPDDPVPYPDPDEAADHRRDTIDMADLGTELHNPEWEGKDGLVYQFALMLNVTPAHTEYARCKKGEGPSQGF